MVSLLNDDIALEYTAGVQYLQHFVEIHGVPYGGIKDELKEHSEEELAHSVIIAKHILLLGGNPVAKTLPFVNGGTFKDMLEVDLKDEVEAVRRYKERITQALEMGELDLAADLQDILAQEEEHLADIKEALDAK